MSDSLLSRLDIRGVVREIDWEETFEDTKLGGLVEDSDGNLGRTIGGAVGAFVGRRLGGIIGSRVSEIVREELEGGEQETGKEEEKEREPDEDEDEKEPEDADEQETEDSDEDVEEASLPESLDELEERSYRELQSLAKEVDVRANLSREEMTERLVETLEIDDET